MLKTTLAKCVSLIGVLLTVIVLFPATVYAEDGMAHEGEAMVREKTIYFPQFQPVQSVVNEPYTIERLQGKLVLSDECLRIVFGSKAYLLIWPGWYTFDIIGQDIVVTHLRTGSVVAQLKIGSTVALSGGELEDRPFDLQYAIPELCKGPYLAVGEIEPTLAMPEKQPTAGFYRPNQTKPLAEPSKPKILPRVVYSRPSQGTRKPMPRPRKPAYLKLEPKKFILKPVARPKPIDEPSEEELEKSVVR